ncbi:SDR family oxidoreductase [Natronorubrum sp. FCH18a]|uniref:SDR family oxidoreductase n=1 Tax=Natronorubrum sp. FCH18a TaxID=3447018 RepID=UPI003F5196D9
MSRLLSGDTAVVTGGSSGIGRSIALQFASHGADVVIADLQPEPREGGISTHKQIENETDASARYVECDVTDVSDLERAVDAADEFGGISIMVNNAGTFRDESFLEVTEAEFDQLMDVNVKGVFFGAQTAARKMVDAAGGSIINLSSVAGYRGAGDYTSYCTSKGAVRLFTYALADRLGRNGIRVNAIHPGSIDTAMMNEDSSVFGTEAGERLLESIPLGERGEPKDVGNTAVYLASDLASYVTGESIIVDGGRTQT